MYEKSYRLQQQFHALEYNNTPRLFETIMISDYHFYEAKVGFTLKIAKGYAHKYFSLTIGSFLKTFTVSHTLWKSLVRSEAQQFGYKSNFDVCAFALLKTALKKVEQDWFNEGVVDTPKYRQFFDYREAAISHHRSIEILDEVIIVE